LRLEGLGLDFIKASWFSIGSGYEVTANIYILPVTQEPLFSKVAPRSASGKLPAFAAAALLVIICWVFWWSAKESPPQFNEKGDASELLATEHRLSNGPEMESTNRDQVQLGNPIATRMEVPLGLQVPPDPNGEIAIFVVLKGSGEPAVGAELGMDPLGEDALQYGPAGYMDVRQVVDVLPVIFSNIKSEINSAELAVFYGSHNYRIDVEWPAPGVRKELKVEVRPSTGMEIVVTLLGSLVPEANVSFQPLGVESGWGWPRDRNTDVNGSVLILDLAAGEFLVGATIGDLTTYQLVLLKPDLVAKVNLEFHHDAELRVILRDQNGFPIRADDVVSIARLDGLQRASCSTSEGKADFQNLMPGEFHIDVWSGRHRKLNAKDHVFTQRTAFILEGKNEIIVEPTPRVEEIRIGLTIDGKEVDWAYINLVYPSGYAKEVRYRGVAAAFTNVPTVELLAEIYFDHSTPDWKIPIKVLQEEGQLFEFELSEIEKWSRR
jgi:hypothetical protein